MNTTEKIEKAEKTETKSRYIKAGSLLPEELLKEVQKYAQGQTLYIPKEKCDRKKWGADSGGRKLINERNSEICRHFKNGTPVGILAERYFLSAESIKRIVYKRNSSSKVNKIKEIRYVWIYRIFFILPVKIKKQ